VAGGKGLNHNRRRRGSGRDGRDTTCHGVVIGLLIHRCTLQGVMTRPVQAHAVSLATAKCDFGIGTIRGSDGSSCQVTFLNGAESSDRDASAATGCDTKVVVSPFHSNNVKNL
jgi:hypothetical protein